MFDSHAVNALFVKTLSSIRRSLEVLESSTNDTSASATPVPSSNEIYKLECSINIHFDRSLYTITQCFSPITVVVDCLRSLSGFINFVDTAGAVIPRLKKELLNPSAVISKQRDISGIRYALTRKIFPIVELPLLNETLNSSCQLLWWPAIGNGECVASPEQHCCGAALTIMLISSAWTIDIIYSLPRSQSIVTDFVLCSTSRFSAQDLRWWMHDALMQIVQRSYQSFQKRDAPSGLQHALLQRMTQLLFRCDPYSDKTELTSLAQLPLGLLFVPSVIPVLLLYDTSSILAEGYLRKLMAASSHLIPSFLKSNAVMFERICVSLTRQVVVGLDVVAYHYFHEPSSDVYSSRAITFMRDIINSALDGIELDAKGRDGVTRSARGLVWALHTNLIHPLCTGIHQLLQQSKSYANQSETELFSTTLRTALYRLWMILEEVGRNELSRSGAAEHSASVSRKRNRRLLQESGGKVTVAILQAAAEDQHLLMEATNTRSRSGHKVYKLHSGITGRGSSTKSLFVYVEDGSIYYKTGSTTDFHVAQSVLDLFKPFTV